VSKDQKKLERVINFMKKGLTSLSDDLEETVKGINDFIKSLNKAMKDLKDVTVEEEVLTESTSSKKLVTPTDTTAKTAAASTLFNLLSGAGGTPSVGTPPSMTATPSAPAGPPMISTKGPPKKPGSSGPPKAPPSGGPPKAPTSGAPRSNLPPAPKLPPSSGGPPPATAGVTQSPTFVKRAAPPAAPTSGAPPRPPGPPAGSSGPASMASPKAGGGLSSLRDEMLEELNRLKKIMRGE
jgi:hypothetical protein